MHLKDNFVMETGADSPCKTSSGFSTLQERQRKKSTTGMSRSRCLARNSAKWCYFHNPTSHQHRRCCCVCHLMRRLNPLGSVASSLPLKAYQQIWNDANHLSTYVQLCVCVAISWGRTLGLDHVHTRTHTTCLTSTQTPGQFVAIHTAA